MTKTHILNVEKLDYTMRKIYHISIDDIGTGIGAISLVQEAAVGLDFLCFDKQPMKFSYDQSKHVISGVIALAGVPIYRWSPTEGEYWVIFDADVIEKMVQRFAKDNLFSKVNLQHDSGQFIDGIYMFESYLVNRERGIAPAEFPDVPNGSWVASYKVDNDELWNEIINGKELNGFSLEGMFQLRESFNKEESESFESWLENIISNK